MTDTANDVVFVRVTLEYQGRTIEYHHAIHESEVARSVLGPYQSLAMHTETVIEKLIKGAEREGFLKSR